MCLAALESMEFVCDVFERRNNTIGLCKDDEEGAAPEGSVRQGNTKVCNLPREKNFG